MSQTDDIDAVFWAVMLADFPAHEERLRPLLPAARAAALGGDQRVLNKALQWFLDEGHPWPRFDKHLADWDLPDPRVPRDDDDEENDVDPFPRPGELLAHRFLMVYHMSMRLQRQRDNVRDRPYWRLVTIPDGRSFADCNAQAREVHRWDSPYWQAKKVPCERLFCRCRVIAMTEREGADWKP